ncbi:MAG: hypothetical protein WBX78_27270, partial [Pseudolabrys sp.]
VGQSDRTKSPTNFTRKCKNREFETGIVKIDFRMTFSEGGLFRFASRSPSFLSTRLVNRA